ncbi:MAG: photosynthetic complex assembly protein PuhC [Pseudomonadota bacterium]
MSAQAKSNAHDRELVPRLLLRAVAALLVIVLAMVTWARVTGMPPTALPPEGEIAKERTLHIFGDLTGSARVLDTHGVMIADLGPNEGGFIAGVARSLAMKRRQAGVEIAAPVRLIGYADGRIALRDDYTGWRAELIGFGKDNTAAFAKLLSAK